MKHAHVIISGFVQGVSFRRFIKDNAQKLGITGWVRNVSNGVIEAQFQGEEEAINNMIQICKKGPLLSEVKSVEVDWVTDKEPFVDFKIIS